MSDLTLTIKLTDAGLAAVAAAHGQGLQAKISHVAIGDAGYVPTAEAIALQHELARVPLTAGGAVAPNQVMVQGMFEPAAAPFFIKELGYFLEDGTLLGLWSDPDMVLGWLGGTTPWFFKLAFAWTSLPDNAITVVIADDAGQAGLALDVARLEGKIRHTVEDAGLIWSETDETQLTAALVAALHGVGLGATAVSTVSTDLDAMLTSGLYSINASAPNNPAAANAVLLVAVSNIGAVQVLWRASTTTANEMFYRSRGANNGWQAWTRIGRDAADTYAATSYTAAGTYTWVKPAGARLIKVTVIGGGGGGGGAKEGGDNVTRGGGGGGGGGGAVVETLKASEVSSNVTVTVGAGGAGGSAIGGDGAAGGTSSFGAYCSATGGQGGVGWVKGYSSSRTTPGDGGAGAGGQLNLIGQGGTLGVGGTNTVQIAGIGGASPLGGGTRQRSSGNIAGLPGRDYGGGGGGAMCNNDTGFAGGNGADGAVIVEVIA